MNAVVPESAWFKSSYSSGAGGECVEVAAWQGTTRVRDSKDTARPSLRLAPQAWAEFIERLPEDK
ncbi:DUF397 domain-containing protein [Streptomyces sp. SID8381]|uniref:DUF397 domain-containing protein n=1 Tax=unclassified Streptomyces TaxID=2593676 RepID=UPI000379F2DA|nr:MULTISPECIES: DUF397 domain-containing protein [unclassified Streptomyces]MYX30327.1 DUF397 domain-containing protein [Streptomyces sp. SID8381]